MSWWSIMYLRLLITAAVRRSPPPAGISGWCMWSAMLKALRIRSKSMPDWGRYKGPGRVIASRMRSSEPQILGRPSTYSGSSWLVICPFSPTAGGHANRALRPRPYVMVNLQVALARMIPGEVVAHSVPHQFAERLGVRVPQADGTGQG